MLHSTTFEQFKALSAKSRFVVVSREIYADMLTPVRVFQALAKNQSQAVLLDSSDHPTSQDACIYIGFDPVAAFKVDQAQMTITTQHGVETVTGNAFDALRDFFHHYKSATQHSMAKFAGGMIGYVGYDAIRFIEEIPEQFHETDVPVMHFKFYGTNIVFDKRTGKALVTKVVEIDDDLEFGYQQAVKANERIIGEMISAEVNVKHQKAGSKRDVFDEVDIDIDDYRFKKMVDQAKDYIRRGDIFQVVLSRRFRREFKGDDFDIYRALRVLNPSPYQFYIRDGEFTVVGASPEKLVSLQEGIVEVSPIAGTRRRGETYDEDQALEKELITDEKELAEHMMLVDLGRNDVGAVSVPGTVEVKEFKAIKRFSSVMHISSTVQGKLREGLDAFDAFKAAFTAGTLSGAPKIRAMQIIDELEGSRRDLYGGAIVAIDNQGHMDSCIIIRTVTKHKNMITVRAGAGIVMDSDPQSEADETRHKAQGVLQALQLAEQGLV